MHVLFVIKSPCCLNFPDRFHTDVLVGFASADCGLAGCGLAGCGKAVCWLAGGGLVCYKFAV